MSKRDTELLDYLQKLNDEKFNTGKCILRLSESMRGWRLHETSRPGASRDVRQAIEDFMKVNAWPNKES